jgi:hypothetical protein
MLEEHKENNKKMTEKLFSKEVEVEERLQSMDRVKVLFDLNFLLL